MSFAALDLALIRKQPISLPSTPFAAGLTSVILHTTSFQSIK